jgi:leucine dehydrogenase
MLLDFGDLVASLAGRYVTAEDVGTGPEDMVVIAERTEHVTGLPPEHGGSGDPSPFTALGVEAAIRACAAHRYGSRDLRGLRIAVVGLGHVGSRLASLLAAAGAELTLADINPAKRAVAEKLDARWAQPDEAFAAPCQVLAPCAMGGALDRAAVENLSAEIVCGAANNQLAEASLAEDLAEAGILYAPDFIANAGGLANVYREHRGLDEPWAREQALGIEATMTRVLVTADDLGITPDAAALELARERLAGALRD